MAAQDLTTAAAVKAWLDITVTTDDTKIAALVTSVSTWIQNHIGRQVPIASYTETRSGSGGRSLVLNHYPVTAITSLSIDGIAMPARSSIGSRGYYLANDVLYLDGGAVYTKGMANIVCVYSGGFAAVPTDLAQAALQLVALKYREKDRIGQVSKSVGGETVSFDMKALPSDVRDIIESYERVSWGT